MWTEREKYLTDFNQIKKHIEDQDGFHDCTLGSFSIKENGKIRFTIEEVIDSRNYPKEGTGKVWDLEADGVSNLRLDIDTAMCFWITEIVPLDNGIGLSIGGVNGYIEFEAVRFELGIPSEIKY